jgi:hypothetical protein
MAKAMTKSRYRSPATRPICRKDRGEWADSDPAKEAKNGFTLVRQAGAGEPKARMGRNPQTGEAIKISRSGRNSVWPRLPKTQSRGR